MSPNIALQQPSIESKEPAVTSLTIKIEQIGISRIEVVKGILDDGTAYLISLGLRHWENFYTVERVAQYLRERNVYLLTYEGVPAGVVATTPDKNSSGWKDNIPSLYMSSLAVLAEYQNKGFGSILLTVVEEEARARGLQKIRFDSVKNYEALSNFYLRRGYSIVGEWGKPYRKFDYFLYERSLSSSDVLS